MVVRFEECDGFTSGGVFWFEGEDALEYVERRFLVVPGEYPAEGVEYKGVFGIEALAFTSRVQRLIPPAVKGKSASLHGMGNTEVWNHLHEARCVFECAKRIRLEGGQPVQRQHVIGGGFDGAPGTRVRFILLIEEQVGLGEGAIHSRRDFQIPLGDRHELFDGLLGTLDIDQELGVLDPLPDVIVRHRSSSLLVATAKGGRRLRAAHLLTSGCSPSCTRRGRRTGLRGCRIRRCCGR